MAVPLTFFKEKSKNSILTAWLFYTHRFGLRSIFESTEVNYVTSSAAECIILSIKDYR